MYSEDFDFIDFYRLSDDVSLRTTLTPSLCKHTVAYLLKARTVVPEKQPLLANGSETTFVSRQRLSKHDPAATDKHATIKVLLETVFYPIHVKGL
jgi:hypothetical protein